MTEFDEPGISIELINDLISKLQSSGSWPLGKLAWKQKLKRCLWIIIFIVGSLGTRAFIGSSFDILSFGLCCFVLGCNCFAKYAVLFLNKAHLYKILKILKTPLFAPHEEHCVTLLKRRIRKCNFLRRLYFYMTMITAILIASIPIPYLHSGRILPLPYPVDMNTQPIIIYAAVWCMQGLALTGLSWNTVSFDTLLVGFMEIAAAQLEILEYEIVHSTDWLKLKHPPLDYKYDPVINKSLKKCVAHHVIIDRYIRSIEKTFSYAFFSQLLASLFVICLAGFNWTLYPIFSIQSGKCCFIFVTVVIQLTIFCIPGNEIVVQGEKIRDACYMTKWNYCGPSVRQSLLLIMLRTERPFALTAAKFVTLSHETLLSILKSALSYFTVLWQLYNNSH